MDLRQAMQMLTYQTQSTDSDSMLIEMATGILKENKTLEGLKHIIETNENMTLKKIHHSSCLSIDARSGEISSLKINPHMMNLGSNYEQRIKGREMEAMFSFGKNLSIKLAFDIRI